MDGKNNGTLSDDQESGTITESLDDENRDGDGSDDKGHEHLDDENGDGERSEDKGHEHLHDDEEEHGPTQDVERMNRTELCPGPNCPRP